MIFLLQSWITYMGWIGIAVIYETNDLYSPGTSLVKHIKTGIIVVYAF